MFASKYVQQLHQVALPGKYCCRDPLPVAVLQHMTESRGHLGECQVNRIPVTSSDLASVGYDSASQLLEVEFRSGAVYQYRGVPIQLYEQLMGAASHGRFFNQQIRNGAFTYVKLR